MKLTSQNKTVEIKNYNINLVQIPAKENNNTAIINLQIKTKEDYNINCIGAYTGDNNQNTSMIIEAASEQAKDKIFEVLYSGSSYNNNNQYNSTQSQDKSKLNGGGNKPITQGQINYINGLADKKHIDAGQIANQVCGKKLDACVGEEAQKIINHLKSLRG